MCLFFLIMMWSVSGAIFWIISGEYSFGPTWSAWILLGLFHPKTVIIISLLSCETSSDYSCECIRSSHPTSYRSFFGGKLFFFISHLNTSDTDASAVHFSCTFKIVLNEVVNGVWTWNAHIKCKFIIWINK